SQGEEEVHVPNHPTDSDHAAAVRRDRAHDAGLPGAGARATNLFHRCSEESGPAVPSNLFIRAVFFECRPSDSQPCLNTQECPGNGAVCDRHLNAIVPVDFNISQPGSRAVEWWGWTSDTGEAALHFDVTVGQ